MGKPGVLQSMGVIELDTTEQLNNNCNFEYYWKLRNIWGKVYKTEHSEVGGGTEVIIAEPPEQPHQWFFSYSQGLLVGGLIHRCLGPCEDLWVSRWTWGMGNFPIPHSWVDLGNLYFWEVLGDADSAACAGTALWGSPPHTLSQPSWLHQLLPMMPPKSPNSAGQDREQAWVAVRGLASLSTA